MNVPGLRSTYDQVGGFFHFGRMLDKIRLHQQGKLPADYQSNLGKGFDARCCSFLHVNFEDLVTRVKLGGEDADILQWCFEQGRKPTDEELEIWNAFMSKRGWNDATSARVAERAAELGPQWVGKIQTFFDVIEVDEGREPRCRI